MRTLGILAHIDSGKTTLSERMLWLAGSIRQCGEVEEGLSALDYLPEEQERGITIQTGIEHLKWKGEAIQLLDTPGHIDFGPEVSGVLSSLDGGVLVVSGVRHLQTQTLSAWYRLKEAEVPTVIFINRLDLPGSDLDETIIRLEDELGISPTILTWPICSDGVLDGVIDVLNQTLVKNDRIDPRQWHSEPLPDEWKNLTDRLFEEAVSAAAEEDEELFEHHLEGKKIDLSRLIAALAVRTSKREILPTYCGSAKKCVGVRQLLNGVVWLLPHGRTIRHDAAIRMIRTRWSAETGRWYTAQAMRPISQGELSSRMFALHAGVLEPTERVESGEVFGLTDESGSWQPGNLISLSGRIVDGEVRIWGEPLLEVRLEAADGEEDLRLGAALIEMTEADPSLKSKKDDGGGWRLSGLGEVHLDVATERLRRDFQLRFRVGEPTVRGRERWIAVQKNIEMEVKGESGRVSLRLSFIPSEVPQVHLVIEDNSVEKGIPRRVLEAAADEFAEHGVAGVGRIVNLRIIVHEVRWSDPFLPGLLKKAADDLFRLRTGAAAVRIEEPFVKLEIWTPGEFHGTVLADFSGRDGKVFSQDSDGYHWKIEGKLPLRKMIGYSVALRTITRGTATFTPIEEGWSGE